MAAKTKSVTATKRPKSKVASVSPNYDAAVDVKAEDGAFVFSAPELYLQMQAVRVLRTPSGLHAEQRIFVDLTVPPDEQRVALYFDATTLNGLDIEFTLSLTPLDDHFQPKESAKVYTLKWTTSNTKPAFLDGPVYLKDLKDPK